MKKSIQFIAVGAMMLLSSCGGGSGDGGGNTENPVAAQLIAPINNSECLSGTPISASQSNVTFEWNAADFTDNYTLMVKNLNSQLTFQYDAAGATSFTVALDQSTPYMWWIVSRAAGNNQPATSEKRKFYNSGPGITQYAPFPAEAVAPGNSSSVSGTTVNFSWTGSDVDNDIVEYKLYMDTNNAPTTLRGTTSNTSLPDIPVSANSIYYWKITTRDQAGNTSDSPVFQFRTR